LKPDTAFEAVSGDFSPNMYKNQQPPAERGPGTFEMPSFYPKLLVADLGGEYDPKTGAELSSLPIL
jgi:hypothetical protein